MEDSISTAVKIIFFLLIFAGGIASDIAKKNKAKKRAEAEEQAEERAAAHTPLQPRGAGAAPKKKTAKPIARTDDSEWLSTLADQKRREAAKTAAKADAFYTDDSQKTPPPPTTPFALSAEHAKEGFILAEILGPPVSMR